MKRFINSFNKSVSPERGAGLVLGPRDMAMTKAQLLIAQRLVKQTSTGNYNTGQAKGFPPWLQYSCQENSMVREAWRATVHRVTKSWT